ncbi:MULTISPECIES: hypothetical protein [unclassified Fusibacter]|uniref:hypothetical protein n=1 Tax=unclassified Fusibacter TaxID=2624464 RepID=UPI00101079D1|nr:MULTISPECIES: hypothetical protein [unclassified Fusibacter]MCK8058143.1 hypothetical protein [Fusibacter sp. A2]NPE20725.1 hypothetical protein [Fusibacter sp. A1]RXV62930.1 hypothetical protein DWB64_02750 [Fusibacter sp. A1]
MNFIELESEEIKNVNGGGLLSAGAGFLAGTIIGAYAGMVTATVVLVQTGDMKKAEDALLATTVMCATTGLAVGALAPAP